MSDELEEVQITEDDIEDARQAFREDAPPEWRNLLDAEEEDITP
jgi:hypothetical protein